MKHASFFTLFPPPRFLLMPHAGIDISDDAIAVVVYSYRAGKRYIVAYERVSLSPSEIEGGDIKDEVSITEKLKTLAKKYKILYAKISIPEEKAYIFETRVGAGSMDIINHNIEFKIEENIPLSAQDTLFAFDILPGSTDESVPVSVSAVPKTYIEHMMSIIRNAGIAPLSFETVPRSLARLLPEDDTSNILIVHAMNKKTGIYIVSGHAVRFTSTNSFGIETGQEEYARHIAQDVERVCSFWSSKQENEQSLSRLIVIGQSAPDIASRLRSIIKDLVAIETGDIWHEVLDTRAYVPPISHEESHAYGPAAGLAF